MVAIFFFVVTTDRMQIDPFGRLAAKVVRCDRLVAVCRNCGMDLAKYHRRFISLSFIYIVLTIML